MTDGELRGWLIALALLLVVNFVRTFFPAYLGRKGQNLADKEDIAAITRQIEGVKNEYTMLVEQFKAERAMLVEQFKAKHQLRVAAVDKRLAAHQQAFTLWRRLLAVLWEGDMATVVTECHKWWNENCLYLEPQARDAFSVAFLLAPSHRQLVEGMAFHGTRYSADIDDRVNKILAAGTVIVESVQLPGLTEEEARALKKEAEPPEAVNPL
jgi:hypothetical protein